MLGYKRMVLVAGLLFLVSPCAAVAQCQDQSCAFDSGRRCFECVSGPNFACGEKNCSSCTTTACIEAPRLAKLGVDARLLSTACVRGLSADQPAAQSGLTSLVPASYGASVPAGVIKLGVVDQVVLSSPALFQVQHTSRDFFSGGLVVNLMPKTLVRYRIGWLIVYDNGNVKFDMGRAIVRKIPHAATARVPAQGLSADTMARSDAREVFFFVASAVFADGTSWNANEGEIKSQVMKPRSNKQAQ